MGATPSVPISPSRIARPGPDPTLAPHASSAAHLRPPTPSSARPSRAHAHAHVPSTAANLAHAHAHALPHHAAVASSLRTTLDARHRTEAINALIDACIGGEDGWGSSRWLVSQRARSSASARGLATIGAACHRRMRALLIDICLFAHAMGPSRHFSAAVCDAWSRFAHRLLRAWEAELRMGADDVVELLGGAIERAWAVGVPQLAPLAPLLSALLRGHMLRRFVPAYAEYTLAEERRLPPPPAPAMPPVPLPPPVPPLSAALDLDAGGRR